MANPGKRMRAGRMRIRQGRRGSRGMVKGSLSLGAAVLVGTVLFGTAAFAQSATPECGAIQKTLADRKALVGRANAASQSKKKMTPQEACALFGKLQTNGAEGLKWITANK